MSERSIYGVAGKPPKYLQIPCCGMLCDSSSDEPLRYDIRSDHAKKDQPSDMLCSLVFFCTACQEHNRKSHSPKHKSAVDEQE